MVASNMLKGNENILLNGAACGLRALVGGAALCAALLLPLPAAAQSLSLGGPPDEVVDELVEESVEENLEEQAEENLQERVEDRVEERVLSLGDAGYEAFLEQSIEEEVEQSVEEEVEESVQDSINDNIEVTLEGNIEDEIEQDVEQTIDQLVDESVEGSVEERIEEAVAESLTDSVESSLEGTVEDELAVSVEQGVESSVEAAVEEEIAVNVEQGMENTVESAVEVGIEGQLAMNVEERLEDTIDQIIEKIEVDESRIQKDQWLVMAAPEVFDQLAAEGYLFATVTELPGMGLRLAEVAAPSSFDISRVRQGVVDVVGSDKAEVDLNHIYTAGDQVSEQGEQGVDPRTAIRFPADMDALPLRIGMIDSSVDVDHPALVKSHIQSRSFASAGATLPSYHGTAIASIIAADSADFVGIAPNSEVFAAAVFEQDPQRGEIASTVSLVRALDWLISSGVDVVNISLAGPPNRLLEAALQRAAERDVMILAAAGNGGPVAEPMYPAAYPTVVAVTAVDTDGRVFRLANRGEYLDISAPGVGMRHARAGGGYAASSGTSFAVPFATTAVARLRALQPGSDVLAMLYGSAEDLGPPGRDSIYGYGLLRPEKS
ncbi:MAG: S8 family serine peptidase [Halieaceae bacterium]|nr:S8 family serine peptidase [Halieaceae bacterium]